jgi:photosystem II stability/assembly factor-like uncharacterized protein
MKKTLDLSSWKFTPSIPARSPILALAVDGEKIWAGGYGGVACYESAWRPAAVGLKLASVTALCSAGGWLFAGGLQGLARSADGGSAWESVEIEGEPALVTCLVASPHFTEEPALLAATMGAGVLRSENAGRTWRAANFGLQDYEVYGLAWGAQDCVLAATADGVYRSNNGGRAWRLARGTEGTGISAVIYLTDGSALAAVDQGGLMRSSDGGASWQFYEVLAANVQVLAMARIEEGSVVLGTLENGTLCFTSGEIEALDEDGAQVFAGQGTRLAAGLPDGAGLVSGKGISRLPPVPLQDISVLLICRGTLLAAGLFSGVWSWQETQGWQALEVPEMVTALVEAPDGALILSGSDGLVRSPDAGETWQSCLAGADGLVARITFRQDGAGWAGSADGARLLRTRDYGQTWEALPSPFGVMPLAALQSSPDRLVAVTYYPPRQLAQLWFSLDEGDSWQRGAEVRTNWPVVATCGNPACLSLGGNLFLLQADGSWGNRKVGPLGSGVRRLASDGETLLALTNTDLLRTIDRGHVWTVEDDLPAIDSIQDIAADEGRLYVLLADGRVSSRTL